jgi:hypothetical protein
MEQLSIKQTLKHAVLSAYKPLFWMSLAMIIFSLFFIQSDNEDGFYTATIVCMVVLQVILYLVKHSEAKNINFKQ